MPTKRTRRTRNRRHANISALAWRFLTDEPAPGDSDTWEFYMLNYNHHDHGRGYSCEELWKLYADEITAAWIKEKPGTRPRCWWRYSAPRKAEQGHRMFPLVETRRVLSGSATSEDRAPVESQAAYLKRHGLLTPEETWRLKNDD